MVVSVVCPKGVMNVFPKYDRIVHKKRWTVKHKCGESKERVRLPANPRCVLKKDYEAWTDKRRAAMRKLVREEDGWRKWYEGEHVEGRLTLAKKHHIVPCERKRL